MLYCKFDLDNLQEIRNKVKKILPDDFLNAECKLDYIYKSREYTTKQILDLDVIKNLLHQFGMSVKDVEVCGFTVVAPNNTLPLHVDKGPFRYSLNIPLTDTDDQGTIVNFFQSSAPLEIKTNGLNSYFSIDKSKCNLICKLVTNKPCIIDTSAIHSVENNTKHLRVMLLIRLKFEKLISDIDLSGVKILEKVVLT